MSDSENRGAEPKSGEPPAQKKIDFGTKNASSIRIREGRSRKGGVHPPPTTPRTNVRPQPQKPSSSSGSNTGSGEGTSFSGSSAGNHTEERNGE